MRIGIDASNLRAGGGVTHLVEFLGAADPRAHGFDHMVIWGGTATLSKIAGKEWLSKVCVPVLDRRLPYRVFWQRFRLASLAKEARCDVLFVPGGSDATGFRPLVTMSRNMLPFEWKELRRYGWSWTALKLVLLRLTQSRTFRTADGVIFLTQYARNAVVRVTGPLPGKVVTIPHGVSLRFFQAPRLPRDPTRFTDAKPCRVLYVSVVGVYKHQWHVADAVARLRATGIHLVLDLVGPSGPGVKRLRRTLRQVDPDGVFINYRGPVAHEELHDIYASADICVFASSCENMPNILLEGMAAGLPLACSRMGPMPEILGDAGSYFDPERPEEIAAAIRQLIDSAELRTASAEAAYHRAKAYSWERCARETVAFLSVASQSVDLPPALAPGDQ